MQLSGVLPAFLDPNKLAGSGWIPSNLPSPNYPPPAIEVNTLPEETIGTGESFTAWQTRETQGGTITTNQVQLDAMGRVVASSSQRVSSSGDIIAENHQVNSPIQVYASGPALEDAFVFTKQSAEVCHE